MPDYFRNAFEGLKDAAQHLMAASHEIQLAGGALVRTSEAVLGAKEEHDDIRETVRRLEDLVMGQSDQIRLQSDQIRLQSDQIRQQSEDIRQLKERLNGSRS